MTHQFTQKAGLGLVALLIFSFGTTTTSSANPLTTEVLKKVLDSTVFASVLKKARKQDESFGLVGLSYQGRVIHEEVDGELIELHIRKPGYASVRLDFKSSDKADGLAKECFQEIVVQYAVIRVSYPTTGPLDDVLFHKPDEGSFPMAAFQQKLICPHPVEEVDETELTYGIHD